MRDRRILLPLLLLSALPWTGAAADQAPPRPPAQAAATSGTGAAVPPDYVIGPEDVLGVLFWRDEDMSGDVTVRPDGIITLPLLGEVTAAGRSPVALAAYIQEAAGKYLTDPNVTVLVRQSNSRKVFITGLVLKPGTYPLTGPRTVMQALSMAGGVLEYADAQKVTILREEAEGTVAYRFNYKDVSNGRRLEQNIPLQPGDTIVVP